MMPTYVQPACGGEPVELRYQVSFHNRGRVASFHISAVARPSLLSSHLRHYGNSYLSPPPFFLALNFANGRGDSGEREGTAGLSRSRALEGRRPCEL